MTLKMTLNEKIINLLTERPGLTASGLARRLRGIKRYQVNKAISELTGAGILLPRDKGSHDGLILTKKENGNEIAHRTNSHSPGRRRKD